MFYGDHGSENIGILWPTCCLGWPYVDGGESSRGNTFWISPNVTNYSKEEVDDLLVTKWG